MVSTPDERIDNVASKLVVLISLDSLVQQNHLSYLFPLCVPQGADPRPLPDSRRARCGGGALSEDHPALHEGSVWPEACFLPATEESGERQLPERAGGLAVSCKNADSSMRTQTPDAVLHMMILLAHNRSRWRSSRSVSNACCMQRMLEMCVLITGCGNSPHLHATLSHLKLLLRRNQHGTSREANIGEQTY